jgi:hypothetical protein
MGFSWILLYYQPRVGSFFVVFFFLKRYAANLNLERLIASRYNITLAKGDNATVSGPRGKRIFSAGFRELTDTRLGKEESAAADRML